MIYFLGQDPNFFLGWRVFSESTFVRNWGKQDWAERIELWWSHNRSLSWPNPIGSSEIDSSSELSQIEARRMDLCTPHPRILDVATLKEMQISLGSSYLLRANPEEGLSWESSQPILLAMPCCKKGSRWFSQGLYYFWDRLTLK